MFEVGQYIIYKNGDRLEIGQIKEIRPDRTARVYYHSGSTAALTDFDLMLPIINSFVIKETSLGGEDNVQA